MDSNTGRMLLDFGLAAALSFAAIALLVPFAPRLGLVDVPDGRKAHGREVPLVGGLAVFAAVVVSEWTLREGIPATLLLACAMVLAVGAMDDRTDLSPRVKVAVQALAGCFMIVAGDVCLHTVGDLLGWRPIGLSHLAVPLTLFALVGMVNSTNMIDGMDGLAGTIALIAFAWYALVATTSGLPVQANFALLCGGALAGFLPFNLRIPARARARVFLGDAGSLMLGFGLGWLAIDLTQGPGRSVPPIAALWVVLLPLADCVSVMARRIRAGRDPFAADRQHLHHYLLARGMSENQALALLAAISIAFGAVGFSGWRLAVPEWALFWPFFFGYFAYHSWIQRAWKKLAIEERSLARGPLEEEQASALG